MVEATSQYVRSGERCEADNVNLRRSPGWVLDLRHRLGSCGSGRFWMWHIVPRPERAEACGALCVSCGGAGRMANAALAVSPKAMRAVPARRTDLSRKPPPPKCGRQTARPSTYNKTVGAVRKRQKRVRKFLTSPSERRTGSTATSKSWHCWSKSWRYR